MRVMEVKQATWALIFQDSMGTEYFLAPKMYLARDYIAHIIIGC